MKNRIGYGVLACMGLLLVFGVLAGGCDVFAPKVASPISGKEVTAPQLMIEVEREERRLADEQRREQAKAEAAVRKAKADAEAQLANLAAAQKIDAAKTEAEAAQVVRDAAAKQADIQARLVDKAADLASARAALDEQTTAALGLIEQKREQALGFARVLQGIPGVAQATTAAGLGPSGIETIFGLALGGAGVGYMQKRARRREDAAYDEAERKAKADAQQNQILLLTLLDRNRNGKIDADELPTKAA